MTWTAKGGLNLETIAPGLFTRRAINRIDIFGLQNVRALQMQNLNS